MRLNTKQTVLVGFSFFSISAFWQMYDGLIPKILTETFLVPESAAGYIMAADNILGIFILPFFGALSDRSKSRFGKRRPFILFGTLAAVGLMICLPIVQNSYIVAPSDNKIITFIIILALLLIAMGSYRSPAVALMPDVTPKPLRSKANAVINLMGALGGVLYLIVTSLLYSGKRIQGLEHINYLPLFIFVGVIMLVSLLVVMLLVNEPILIKERQAYENRHPDELLTVEKETGSVIPRPVRRSLMFLLISISLWFIGYNGITTWFTTYAKAVWNMEIGAASLCLTVATLGAIVSYIPMGVAASKIGRKNTIKFGVLLLFTCFTLGFIYTICFNYFHWALYFIFAFVGVAWAAINVNSLPMVVEMCSGADIGKFTGYYYTFSMAGQIVTPIIAGYLLQNISYKILFLYSAIFVLLSFITICLVKHGDTKQTFKGALEAFDVED